MTTAQVDLQRFLALMVRLRGAAGRKPGWRYDGAEHFVVERGRWWTASPRPAGVRWGTRGECFRNAANLSVDSGLTYVEGYALRYVPTEHAWCVDAAGSVVDNTWRDEPAADVAYLGVPFDAAGLCELLRRSKHYGLLCNRVATPLILTDPDRYVAAPAW